MYIRVLFLLLLMFASSYIMEHITIKSSNYLIRDFMASERNPASYLTTKEGQWSVDPQSLTDIKQRADVYMASKAIYEIKRFFKWILLFLQISLCAMFAFLIAKLKNSDSKR